MVEYEDDESDAVMFAKHGDPTRLVRLVSKTLREKGLAISCAESLTGGMVADLFVTLEGASDVFCGGVVTYTDEVKTKVLGVDSKLLQEHTAYDPEVAVQMAVSVREMFGTDYAISTTGVAGPGSDRDVPAGKGYIAVARRDEVFVEELNCEGGRNDVRVGFAVAPFLLLHELFNPVPGFEDCAPEIGTKWQGREAWHKMSR